MKVADFGLSRLQAATCGEPLTAELGTWQWMAPEVVAPWDKRGAIYTEKADVYSFGIVMWECAAREVIAMPGILGCIHLQQHLQITHYPGAVCSCVLDGRAMDATWDDTASWCCFTIQLISSKSLFNPELGSVACRSLSSSTMGIKQL